MVLHFGRIFIDEQEILLGINYRNRDQLGWRFFDRECDKPKRN